MEHSLEHILQLLRSRHPALVMNRPYTVVSEGSANLVLIFGNPSEERWVFRIRRINDSFTRHDIVREQRLVSQLQPMLNVQVPLFTHISHDEDDLVYDASPYVEGKPLLVEYTVGMKEEVKRSIAGGIGIFLRTLHKYDAGPSSEEYLPAASKARWSLKYEMVKTHVRPHLNDLEWSYSTRLFERLLTDGRLWCYKPVITHGDMKGDHILYDEVKGCLCGMIDLGLRWNDPAIDFCFFPMYGGSFLDAVLEAYSPQMDPVIRDKALLYYQLSPFDGLIHHAIAKDEKMLHHHLLWPRAILET